MRDKIKQLLNKEEGFTLIELLGVIVILGLIIAIAIPSIGGIIKKAEVGTNSAQNELIIDAAQMYYIQGGEEDPVSVQTLITNEYLESKVLKNTDTLGTVTRAQAMEGLEGTSTNPGD